MRSTLYALAALPLAAQAIQFVDETISSIVPDGVLRFPISTTNGAVSKHTRKRQATGDLTSQKTGFFYTIQIEIGTPPQAVSVNFDTGSSELWVNPVCSKASDPGFCETFGRYTESTTFVDTKAPGGIKYGTGYVDFEYGYDFVQIGSAKISQQLFGVATDSEFANVGILGAGPSLNGWNSPYPYVLDNLAEQNLINSRAFSLDIRRIGSARGAVIFGGIDTKKFSGPLEKRPIIDAPHSPDGYTRYWVYLDGLTITKEDGSDVSIFDSPGTQPVLLDSGYTISMLPEPHFSKILAAFPSAKLDEDSGEYFVDCSIGKSKGSVNFKFGKTTVNVDYNDFIWKQDDGTCKLGVGRDDAFPVLGDSFLRAAYVVYDWDNRNIWVANNEDCGSKLVAIGKGADAVPASLVGECGAVTTSTTSAAPTTSTSSAANTTKPLSTGIYNTTAVPTSSRWNNATSSIYATPTVAPTYTSTFTTTKVYTITSCAPTVTNCPVGHVTTEIVTAYTTWCPGNTPGAPAPTTSSPPRPQVTATYTLPHTYTCSKGRTSCSDAYTTPHVVTVTPIATQTAPVTVPHCTTCAAVVPQPSGVAPTAVVTNPINPIPTHPAQTSAYYPPPPSGPGITPAPGAPAPTGGLTTIVTPGTGSLPAPTGVKPVTGSAADIRVPGIVAVIAGVVAAALL